MSVKNSQGSSICFRGYLFRCIVIKDDTSIGLSLPWYSVWSHRTSYEKNSFGWSLNTKSLPKLLNFEYFLNEILSKFFNLSETSFLANAAASFIIGMLAIIVRRIGFGNSLDMVIVGSIMPLLPGVALTNGIRDFISGDLISGVSRVSEALLTAIAIAVGIGSALKLLIMLGGVI